MTAWRWISIDVALAIHDRQLHEHGGLPGIKDLGAVESGLARPVHRAQYDAHDIADLAAAYCFGIVRNHGFSDGNKRTGWVLARLFLLDHGVALRFTTAEAVRAVEDIAAGRLSEAAFADWLRQRFAS